MAELPTLFGLAALLGLKHGFDADHLAAIDGLARLQSSAGGASLARCSGLLFSVGHGIVIVLAGLWLGGRVETLPGWLDNAGGCISVAFLTTLGIVNLREATRPASRGARGVVAPWLLQSALARHPLSGLAVGALFAFSLDTLSGAAWFGTAGARHGGAAVVVQLALVFAGGMIVADTLNGVWIAGLLARSEAFARPAARLFSLIVATAALLVAAYGAARLRWSALDTWAGSHALSTGLAVIVLMAVGFAVALGASRRITLPHTEAGRLR